MSYWGWTCVEAISGASFVIIRVVLVVFRGGKTASPQTFTARANAADTTSLANNASMIMTRVASCPHFRDIGVLPHRTSMSSSPFPRYLVDGGRQGACSHESNHLRGRHLQYLYVA